MTPRRQLGVVFFTVFLDLVGFGIVIPLLPLYAEHFHASDLQIGLLLSVYSMMQLVAAPLWGRLSDRVGRRPVLLVSIGGSCLSQLGYAVAPTFTWLIAARALSGACGANVAAAQAYVADVTEDHERARGMALLGTALGLGFVFGPAIGGLLSRHTPNLPFFVAGALSAINFVVAAQFLDEPRERRIPTRTITRAGLRQALQSPRILWAILLFFVVTFGFSMLEATFSLYLERRFGYGRRDTALLFTYIGLIIIFVQGLLVRRLVPRLGERRLVITGTLLMAVGFVLMAFVQTRSPLLIAIAIVAVGNALNTPCLSSLISRLAGSDVQGGILGVSQSAGALARITGPVAGTSALVFGLGAPYALGAAVLLIAALVATLAVRQPTATSPAQPA